MTAEEAVIEAIKEQNRNNEGPNRNITPKRAVEILLEDREGELDSNAAWKEIEAAISSLVADGRIEASSAPGMDWKIL